MPRCRNVGCIHYSSRLVRGRSHRSSNRCRNSSSSLSSYQAAASSAWGLLTAGGAGAWAGAFFLSERGACITGLTLSQLRAAAAAEAAAGAEIVFAARFMGRFASDRRVGSCRSGHLQVQLHSPSTSSTPAVHFLFPP